MLHAVVMAGGSGTRFWPASRSIRPKQLLDLTGDESMLQATIRRLEGYVEPQNTLVVTNQKLVESIRQQLPHLPAESIIGEPCKRDTAPCIGLAAALISKNDPNADMVVMPSDHVIKDFEAFRRGISSARELLEEDRERLVTFGIRPSYPSESFGYIERDHPLRNEPIAAYRVKKFREKPDVATARMYLESGDFYWNAGIFVWSAKTILNQLRAHEPEMSAHIATIADSIGRPEFQSTFESEFAKIVGKSIDYAILEHAKEVVVVESPFDWDDVGSWQALPRLNGTDEHGNTILANHLGIDTQGTIVRGENDHLIVTLGVKNCLVVHTPDATLVADKSKEESVREVVKLLEERKLNRYL